MNCCSEKLLENSFLHQKFKSPPPKPPRRRHSEQLVSDKCSLGKLKCADGFHLQNVDSHKSIIANKSSASLPANLTAELGKLTAEKCLFNRNPYSSLRHQKKSLFDVFPCGNQSEKTVYNAEESSITNDFCENASEYPYFSHPKKRDMPFLKSLLRNSPESSENNRKQFNSDFQKSKNSPQNLKPLHSESHRRHHSDPLLPCFTPDSKEYSETFDYNRHSSMRKQINQEDSEINEQVNVCLACKEIQCLQEETEALKEINDKLWQNLLTVQSTLENIQNVSSGANCKTPFTEFLSEFYYAQKAKECAMEERLKVVVEDRNAAFLEMDNMVEAVVALQFEDSVESDGLDSLTQSAEKSSNKDIEEVLQEIEMAENPITLLQKQKLMLGHIYRSKEARNGYLSHELRLVLKEKDNLLEKVKVLETELNDLKQCNDLRYMDHKHWEDSLLDMFCYVVQQRNFVLSKMENCQNTDHICQRPAKIQKIISKQHFPGSECEPLAHADCMVQKSKASSHSKANVFVQQCDIFLKEPKLLKDEVTLLSNALDVEVQKSEEMEARCQRLERLVNVLQKKIGGKNSGILV